MSTAESTIVAPAAEPTFVVRKWQSNLSHLVAMLAHAVLGNLSRPTEAEEDSPIPGLLLSFEIRACGIEKADIGWDMHRPLATFHLALCDPHFDGAVYHMCYLYIDKPESTWQSATPSEWRSMQYYYDINRRDDIDNLAEAYINEAAKLIDLSTMTFSGVKLLFKPEEWQGATVHLTMDLMDGGITHVTMRKNILERKGSMTRYRYEIIPPPEQPEGQG